MTITRETINGKEYNVIHTPADQMFVCKSGKDNGMHSVYVVKDYVALPALPKHPKPEHAQLLHLYAAHGVEIKLEGYRSWEFALEYHFFDNKITHLTYNNETITDFAMEDV